MSRKAEAGSSPFHQRDLRTPSSSLMSPHLPRAGTQELEVSPLLWAPPELNTKRTLPPKTVHPSPVSQIKNSRTPSWHVQQLVLHAHMWAFSIRMRLWSCRPVFFDQGKPKRSRSDHRKRQKPRERRQKPREVRQKVREFWCVHPSSDFEHVTMQMQCCHTWLNFCVMQDANGCKAIAVMVAMAV